MDRGTENGFDTAFYRDLTTTTTIPVVASGGASSTVDFEEVFVNSGVCGRWPPLAFYLDQMAISRVKEILERDFGSVQYRIDHLSLANQDTAICVLSWPSIRPAAFYWSGPSGSLNNHSGIISLTWVRAFAAGQAYTNFRQRQFYS